MTTPRESEAREIAFEILGYPKDKSIAGMAASDYQRFRRIEKALLSFGQKEYERGIKDQQAEIILKLIEQKGGG